MADIGGVVWRRNLSSESSKESVSKLFLHTIKNFRAYRKPQTFAFGSDVTVLYGANGFGKTSFFDAVDFAATGEIGRIKPHGDEHFKKMAPHLDSKPEESTVSLSFWCNGALRKIARTVSDRKYAILDGIRTDRKRILGELTGGDFLAADRVENFVSLFRATHLFNQEQPELTKDFQDDCRLPSEIVARMLAFEDYASALAHVSQRGRVAAKSSLIRRRRQINIRKSSYGPSSTVLLAVLAPRTRFRTAGKIEC
jgi:exonuclease SbcC